MNKLDAPTPTHVPRTLGWLLISGAAIFWTGAVTPPYRQWAGVSLEEYLGIVHAHPLNWLAMHVCFAVGSLITVIGLSGLFDILGSTPSRVWRTIGVALFAMGATLWMICIAYRVTMTVDAAAQLAQTGEIPVGYAATHRWMGLVFGMFMLLSYLGLGALGAALLQSQVVRPWAGKTALAFGLLGVPGLATPVFQPPLMVFVAPFVIGVAVVRAARRA